MVHHSPAKWHQGCARLSYIMVCSIVISGSLPYMSPMTAQLVVPNSMKDVVLNQLHNQAGHLGVHKTTEKVKEKFYWPGYEQDIENWVHACQKRDPH